MRDYPIVHLDTTSVKERGSLFRYLCIGILTHSYGINVYCIITITIVFILQGSVNFKFGVITAREAQSSDDEFYSNGKY